MNGWPLRALAAFTTVAAMALLAAVVAWWAWRAFGPAPAHVVATTPADPAATILASGLLAGPGPAAPPPPAPAKDEGALATGDTRLLGVFAERDGRGYALFRLPSGPRLVAAGGDIAQGATLVEVRPDGITVRDAGGERRIALRVPPPAKPAAPPVARVARSSVCAIPAGFTGTVLRLNAELFQGIIAKPEGWTALVAPERGGLAVRDETGFVAMLAMKKGDRLEQANGVALGAPEDVIGAVLRPLAAEQSVRIRGSRNGVPREWLLLNAGTCPG
ncbi:MAG: type II secretion system protein N [Burkholderiales bacterium]